MPKTQTLYICQQCGAQTPKWLGKCPNCGQWGSLVETLVEPKTRARAETKRTGVQPTRLAEVKKERLIRAPTTLDEFDRVLGGGIVPKSVVLVAGEPGIGKSTLLLQLAAKVAGSPWETSGKKTTSNNASKVSGQRAISALYVSGEESIEQIKLRSDRLGLTAPNMLLLAETDVDRVTEVVRDLLSQKPGPAGKLLIVIIDSIQAMFTTDLSGAPGSVGQVRECAYRLHELVKKEGNAALFLVGHVTKEGVIAGPKVLEHLVDTVLYFEGERFCAFRLLRVIKNRFGPTDEVGVFEMTEKGMLEVKNPSQAFLSEQPVQAPGSVVVATMEGTRPVLVEIQALVVPTKLAVPRRTASGVDYNRLIVLCAVLQKRLHLPLATADVYLNVAGGIRVSEPAADLPICLAIVLSLKNKPIGKNTCVFGEVGLLGEIRRVGQSQKRLKEARKVGFTKFITPETATTLAQAVKQATSQ